MRDHLWIGADIGGTKLLLVAVREEGYESHRVPTGMEAGPAQIEREIRCLMAQLAIPPAGVGVAVPDPWRACTVRGVRAGEAVAALGAARAVARLAKA